MATDEPVITVPAIMLDPDELAAADPGVCARTGRVTTHRRRESVYNIPLWLYAIQRSVGIPILAPFIRSSVIRLPIAEALRRRLRGFELVAATGGAVAALGLVLGIALRSPALFVLGLAALTVPVAIHLWKRGSWVQVTRLRGPLVSVEGCHPRFVEELERLGVETKAVP